MKLRLSYFPFPFWRAEISRVALFMANIPFENHYVSFDELRAMKKEGSLPFGQVPILEVDGQIIAQTGAIARFCGKLSDLYPRDNDIEAALIDQFIDAATDITMLFSPTMFERDQEKKLAARAEIAKKKLPRWLGHLEDQLGNDDSGYLVGGRLTMADLTVWRLIGWFTSGTLDGIPGDAIAPYPKLNAHFEKIDALPKIRSWMDGRYPVKP